MCGGGGKSEVERKRCGKEKDKNLKSQTLPLNFDEGVLLILVFN